MTRRLNAAALSLVKSFEGFEPKWYRDPVGIWTIGYGHTDAAGSPKYATSKGLVLTEGGATEILARDLDQYAAAVERTVKVPLNDNQFGALVSWCYNVGPGAVGKSTLVRKLNAGDYASVPAELAKWNKAGGKTLKGLVRRRAAEADLWREKASPAPVSIPEAPKPPESEKPAPEAPEGEDKAVTKSQRFWTWLLTAIGAPLASFGALDWRVQLAIVIVIVGFASYAIATMPAVRKKLGMR